MNWIFIHKKGYLMTNECACANGVAVSEVNVLAKVNAAIDELHVADDLIELVFMAAIGDGQDCIRQGSGIAQEYLQSALVGLKAAAEALRAARSI